MTRPGVWFAAILLLGGCALLGKSEPLSPHYYSPERAAPTSVRPTPSNRTLRLGAVIAGSEIRQNLVVRISPIEVAYDEAQRWTERPEEYLRRALSRRLFEDGGIQRAMGGAGPTLRVELVAFEEVSGPPRRARVTAVAIVHDDRVVHLERTFTVELPTRDDSMAAVVSALGDGLIEVVDNIAVAVLAAPTERTAGGPLSAGQR